MAAFDLGLALVSFVVVVSVQALSLSRFSQAPWWQVVNWPVAGLAATAMLIGGHVTSRFAPPVEHVARRFLRRTLVPLLVAFPAVSLAIALLLATLVRSPGGLGFFPYFALTLT